MKKTIIVFSNPFGYGPTGNAIPILKTLSLLKNIKILFVGSGLCLEILPKEYDFHILDERNEEEIEKFLSKKKNVYVLGVQNRFCIKVAKKMDIPCAFIDILAWFWKEIPKDHLIADEIFWLKFIGVEDRLEYNEKIHLVSGIVEKEKYNKSKDNKDKLLIHLGGAKYPVINGIAKNYLKLISASLNSLVQNNIYKEVCLVSSNDSVEYIKTAFNLGDRINIKTMTRKEYINNLLDCKHFMTTAGVSSTLEALFYRKPVSFLLPINLSQMALTDFFVVHGFKLHKLDWEKYVNVDENIRNMTERDGILEIERYSEKIINNSFLLKSYLSDFISLSQNIPIINDLDLVIKYIGSTGSREICDILKKKWNLT